MYMYIHYVDYIYDIVHVQYWAMHMNINTGMVLNWIV